MVTMTPSTGPIDVFIVERGTDPPVGERVANASDRLAVRSIDASTNHAPLTG